jgi:hypothetical protein
MALSTEMQKYFDCLVDRKKTISQIAGRARLGKTSLLLMAADFYISLGNRVLFIDYGINDLGVYAEIHNIPSILSDKLTYLSNVNVEKLLKEFESKPYQTDKVVILIDGLDDMSTPQFVGAPTKKKNYYSTLLSGLINHSTHVIFTNRCYHDWKDLDNVTLITTIKIPVHYSIILSEPVEINQEMKTRYVKAKRVHKIANLKL